MHARIPARTPTCMHVRVQVEWPGGMHECRPARMDECQDACRPGCTHGRLHACMSEFRLCKFSRVRACRNAASECTQSCMFEFMRVGMLRVSACIHACLNSCAVRACMTVSVRTGRSSCRSACMSGACMSVEPHACMDDQAVGMPACTHAWMIALSECRHECCMHE